MSLLDRAKELIALVPKEGEYVNAPIAAQYARAVVELAEALCATFAVLDSPEMKAEEQWALVHGFAVEKELSDRNMAALSKARAALKRLEGP